MDSKQQDDMGRVLKHIVSLVLLVMIAVIMKGWNSKFNTYANEKAVSCIKFNDDPKIGLLNIISEVSINNINDDIKLNNCQLVNSKIDTAFLSNKEQSTQNSINNINVKVNGFAISIADNTFGYVASSTEREVILNKICKRYIDELGLDTKDISNIQVTGKIEATQDKINISQLNSSGEISEEIYNASVIDDELLGLKMTVALSEKEIVTPEIIINSDEELYMGVEQIDDGTPGSRLVFKVITYEGLAKSEEKIIDEELLVEAIPTVIRKGIRNPYVDGVAFLVRPIDGGYLSSVFGEARSSSYHKGIDYANNIGECVNASLDGKVISAGYNDGGYGNLIVLEHNNNMKTYYAHLNEIYVSIGKEVKKGEVIGCVGNTGFSTGPHLHFELRINDEPVNPINYILE